MTSILVWRFGRGVYVVVMKMLTLKCVQDILGSFI